MEKPTLEQLKAAAFDRITEVNKLSAELQQLSKMIAEYGTQPVTDGKEPAPTEVPEADAEVIKE